MLSNYLSSIEDISIFPVIAFIIFFGMFIFVLVWVFKTDKKYIQKMENLPLEKEIEFKTNSEIKNEIV